MRNPLRPLVWSLALGVVVAAQAEFVTRPDADTLWREDGRQIQVGGMDAFDQWRGGAVTIAPREGGGFTLTSNGLEKTTGRSVPLSAEHPWLTFEIVEVSHTEGYRGWTMWLLNESSPSVIGQSVNVPKGLYVFRLWPRTSKPAEESGFLRLDLHHTTLGLRSMAMVRRPAYLIEMDSPALAKQGKIKVGDTIEWTVTLPAAAEDVSLTFFDANQMLPLKLNGQGRLQLKPVEGNSKQWRGSLRLERCEGYSQEPGQGALFKPGRLWVKATVLGEPAVPPVWTCNDVPIEMGTESK